MSASFVIYNYFADEAMNLVERVLREYHVGVGGPSISEAMRVNETPYGKRIYYQSTGGVFHNCNGVIAAEQLPNRSAKILVCNDNSTCVKRNCDPELARELQTHIRDYCRSRNFIVPLMSTIAED
ncbi:MAG: hypothetical protein QXT19_05105 [Candidatus Woesearchaeota archaeon]